MFDGFVVVVVVAVVAVEGRVMMALEVDFAVFEVVLEARERGRLSKGRNWGLLGW